jgi:hypothetical protein
MPKVNKKYHGQREPNPNTLPPGKDYGGYSVINPDDPPEAKHPEKVRQYRGETPKRCRPWNKHRPRATGHRK